jgi:preprotein translocase subunit YajC
MSLLIPLILLAVMYMLLIRPQQQRVRRQRTLVSSLEVGDTIVTIGGIVGEIVRLADETADVEIADGIVVTFLRPAINRKLDQGGPAVPDDSAADAPDVPDVPEAGA